MCTVDCRVSWGCWGIYTGNGAPKTLKRNKKMHKSLKEFSGCFSKDLIIFLFNYIVRLVHFGELIKYNLFKALQV